MLDFMTGKKTLPLTYDPFFKKMFHPDIHPERLSRMLSAIMGMKVKVLKVLPSDDTLVDGNTILIMDIVVELEDGSIVNVEIQKIPFRFPAERMSCYSSDMLMRQYARVKSERGQKFTYRDIKKVYTIVFFEDSVEAFHHEELEGAFIHHGRTTFDTELKLELLQEYYLIALDVFRDSRYARDINEMNGWISLLVTESVEQAYELMQVYPWLESIYADMAEYMQRPQEVLGMFSEALKILDRNTMKLMVDEMKQEADELKQEIEEKKTQLEEKKTQLEEKDKKLEEKDKKLEEKDKKIEELEKKLAQLQKEQ